MAGMVPTPTIDKYGKDLTAMAIRGELDPTVGREKEIARAFQVLMRRRKNNPVFIGEPGVGKTALAEGIAILIATGQAPPDFKGYRIVSLDMGSLVAGSKFRGDFEARVKAILAEAEKCPNLILYIDEMHLIAGAGKSDEGMGAGDLFKTALSRGKLKMMGSTTLDEYREKIEKDPALHRRFEPILVPVPTDRETLEIVKSARTRLEEHHKLKFDDDALVASVELGNRYLVGDVHQPDVSITLLDDAAAMVRLRSQSNAADPRLKALKELKEKKEAAVAREDFEEAGRIQKQIGDLEATIKPQKMDGDKPVVTVADIQIMISQKKGIPITELTADESAKLLAMEEEIAKVVIGQPDAAHAVAVAVRMARGGFKDPKRPVGSFIFAGPTGLGKTLLVKKLAGYMFGDEKAIIRLDMSEFMEKNSVTRLNGPPPGYVGYEEGGELTEKVRRKPYSIVLLDEIEKAHPDVFNMLLQVLEDGHMTDNHGREIDFKNTLIIMTSNAGADKILALQKAANEAAGEKPRVVVDDGGFGFGTPTAPQPVIEAPPVTTDLYDKMREAVLEDLRRKMKPEFLNRLDDVVVFRSLSKPDQIKVVALEVGYASEQLRQTKHMTISATEEAKAFLAEVSTADLEGGRALRRIVEQRVKKPISELMLRGEFAGAQAIEVQLTGSGADRKLIFVPIGR